MSKLHRFDRAVEKLRSGEFQPYCIQSYFSYVSGICSFLNSECGIRVKEQMFHELLCECGMLTGTDKNLTPTEYGISVGFFGMRNDDSGDSLGLMCDTNAQEFILEQVPVILRYVNKEYLFACLEDSVLTESIDVLCGMRKIQWEAREDGKLVPQYPEEILRIGKVLNLVGREFHSDGYRGSPDSWLPTEMDLSQIRAMFTHIYRLQMHDEGAIATYIQNGTLLKIFLRLEDLKKRATR